MKLITIIFVPQYSIDHFAIFYPRGGGGGIRSPASATFYSNCPLQCFVCSNLNLSRFLRFIDASIWVSARKPYIFYFLPAKIIFPPSCDTHITINSHSSFFAFTYASLVSIQPFCTSAIMVSHFCHFWALFYNFCAIYSGMSGLSAFICLIFSQFYNFLS